MAPHPLSEAHRQAQIAIRAETIVALHRLFPLLDLSNLAGTAPDWIATTMPVIRAQWARSAATSAVYYRHIRALQLPGATPIRLPSVIFNEKAATTSLIVLGVARVKASTGRGVPADRVAEIADSTTSQAGARHSLSGGRDLLMSAIAKDPRAIGYERVTSGAACDFCEELAGLPTSADTFEAHDHCGCTAEPAFAA